MDLSCEFCDSHSSVVEGSSLDGCYVRSTPLLLDILKHPKWLGSLRNHHVIINCCKVIRELPYFPAHKTHRDFSLEILEKKNKDDCILILVIYWKKIGLLHTKISNHNIIHSYTWKLKGQLVATDWFLYCKTYCSLNMFRAPLCPSSGPQDLYRWTVTTQ